jgi:putative FmdB family regulatory protein
MLRLPTYEYHCDSCDQNFDVVQSFQDDPLTSCPTCGSPVRKVFGNVGIVFKGAGFYKNDSRKASPAKTTAGDSSPTPTSGSESSGSESDGKAAAPSNDSSPSTSETPPKKASPTAPTPSSNGKASSSKSSTP